jgi:hypothetical protein
MTLQHTSFALLLLLACGSDHRALPDAALPDAADGDTGLGTCEAEGSIDPLPSTQQVRFTFEGGAGFIATAGDLCDPFTIGDLTLSPPHDCACGCPPPNPHVLAVQPSSEALEWDGRQLATWINRCVDCGFGHSAGATGTAPQPAPSGTYTARFLFFAELPAHCESIEGDYPCGSTGSPRPSTAGGHCASYEEGEVVEVEFTLPESGDVDVVVPLPAE